jgi:periplasmic divalent cation tolerance protein
MAEPLLVLTTVAPEAAEDLAQDLVRERLAACVNVIAGMSSIYRWEGDERHESESLLLIKTTRDRWVGLQEWARLRHPYQVPELLALEPSDVSGAYLDWWIAEMHPDV